MANCLAKAAYGFMDLDTRKADWDQSSKLQHKLLLLSGIRKNLFEEKTSPTLLFASGTFTKLLGPSIPKRKDSFTGESSLYFSTSLPSSLTTDPPPTPLSVSSYGSMEKPTLPLESVDVSCLPPCQVSVRPLVLKAFPTNPILQKDMEEDERLVSTES